MKHNVLTIFGSAAGFPTEKRPRTTAIGLWRGGALYLFDAGEGVASEFPKRGLSTETLRAVFVSHTHADHTGGLPMLVQWHQLNRRKSPLACYLPAEEVALLRGIESLTRCRMAAIEDHPYHSATIARLRGREPVAQSASDGPSFGRRRRVARRTLR